MDRIVLLVICLMLVFTSSCGNIYKKPLPDGSIAQIIQEINTTLNEFFTIIYTEPEHENLKKVVSNLRKKMMDGKSNIFNAYFPSGV